MEARSSGAEKLERVVTAENMHARRSSDMASLYLSPTVRNIVP
jgi:hypothetical protein